MVKAVLLIWLLSAPAMGQTLKSISSLILNEPLPAYLYGPSEDRSFRPLLGSLPPKDKALPQLKIPLRSPRVGDRPLLQSAAPEVIELPKGQTIKLKINALTPPEAKVIWYREQHEICTGLTCEISSQTWQAGEQLLRAQVFHDSGAFEVHFKVQVLLQLTKNKEAIVEPISRERKPFLTLKDTDPYILSIGSQSVQQQKNQLQIIDPLAKPLFQPASVRTSSVANAYFSPKPKELSVQLFKSSEILLDAPQNEAKMTLKKGLVRIRKLREGARFVIETDGDLRFSTQGYGDILVQSQFAKGEFQIKALCLGGLCQLRSTGEAKDLVMGEKKSAPSSWQERWQEQDFSFYPGEMLEVEIGKERALQLKSPRPQAMSTLFSLSTKAYLDPLSLQKDRRVLANHFGELQSSLVQDKKLPLKAIFSEVKRQWRARQPLLTLEALAYLDAKSLKAKGLALALARVYLELNLLDQVISHAKMAQKSSLSQDGGFYLEGLSHLLKGDPEKALELFQEIDEEKLPKPWQRVLIYHRGVASYLIEDDFSAKHEMLTLRFDPLPPPYPEPTEELYWFSLKETPFFYDVGVLLGQQDNVTKVKVTDERLVEAGFTAQSSTLARVHLDLGHRLEEEGILSLASGLKVSSDQYTDPLLNAAGYQNFELYTKASAKVGPKDDPVTELHTKAFLERRAFGSVSKLDGFGLEFEFVLPFLWSSPGLLLEKSQYLDPDPEGINLWDPYTHDPAGATSRSSRNDHIGLTFYPYAEEFFKLKVTTLFLSHKKRESLSTGEGFSGPLVRVDYQKDWSASWGVKSMLSFAQRTYEGEETAQKLSLGAELAYRFRTQWVVGVVGSFDQLASSQSENSYQDTVVGLRLRYSR